MLGFSLGRSRRKVSALTAFKDGQGTSTRSREGAGTEAVGRRCLAIASSQFRRSCPRPLQLFFWIPVSLRLLGHGRPAALGASGCVFCFALAGRGQFSLLFVAVLGRSFSVFDFPLRRRRLSSGKAGVFGVPARPGVARVSDSAAVLLVSHAESSVPRRRRCPSGPALRWVSHGIRSSFFFFWGGKGVTVVFQDRAFSVFGVLEILDSLQACCADGNRISARQGC